MTISRRDILAASAALARLGGIAVVSLCLIPSTVSALVSPPLSGATKVMNCEFQRFGRSGQASPGKVEIQISEDILLWFEPVVLVRPETRAGYEGLKYKILEGNEVGVVAVRTSAYSEIGIGPVLNARVLTIRNLDGALRVDSAGADGVVNLLKGTCK